MRRSPRSNLHAGSSGVKTLTRQHFADRGCVGDGLWARDQDMSAQ